MMMSQKAAGIMQSRLALYKLNRMLLSTTKYQIPFSSSSSGNGGDQEAEAMTQGVDTEGETAPHNQEDNNINIIPTRKDDHYVPPNTVGGPQNLSSSKLESPAVNKPFDPHIQQMRSCRSSNSKEELSCAGLDGSPCPEDKNTREEDKDYFQHHKASPLSEIEIGDSRKHVSRATDGGYFGDEQVITWRPEQLDTAEESLRRATQMFRESAMRGVPEWPHSRRLRELRGEDW